MKSAWKTKYEKFHFALVNILARLFGIAACAVGVLGIYSGIHQLINTGSFASLVVGFFALLIGVPFLFAKPSRPDVDGYFGTKNHQAKNRSWWTGSDK